MTDYEVGQRLGYDPCVCGNIDGTWHSECYRGKTEDHLVAGHKLAYKAAREHLKRQAEAESKVLLQRIGTRK